MTSSLCAPEPVVKISSPHSSASTLPASIFHEVLAQRKNLLDPAFQDLKDHLKKKCEEHLTPGALEYIDYQACKSKWWTTGLEARLLPRALEHLALGGVLFDKKYTEAAVGLFNTLIRHREERLQRGIPIGVAGDPWLSDDTASSNLNSGTAALSLAVAFDLIRPSVDQGTTDRIAAFLIPFVEYLADRPADPEVLKPEWNFAVHARAGLGTLALALKASGHLSDDRFSQAIEMGIFRSTIALDLHDEADGALLEGPGYGSSEFHSLGIFSWALARSGNRKLIDHPVWPKAVLGLVYELIPGTQEINPLNDASTKFIATLDWLAMVAAERKDGVAQWLWQFLTRHDGKIIPELPDHARKCIMTCYMLCYDPSVKPISPEEAGLATSKHFRRKNIVDIRSGWKNEDSFFSFICDITPRGGHRQADRNHFAFHCLGEAFAIDCGKNKQEYSKGFLLWGALGESHNIPMFNGEMQRLVPVKNDGITKIDLNCLVPHLEAEAGDGYGLVKSFRRRVALLPSSKQTPCLVISDFAQTLDLSVKLNSWLLHTHAENKIEIQDRRVILTGGKNGHGCLVQMINTEFGCWRAEPFLDHQRLRFDWFDHPLYCMVVIAPFRRGEPPPTIHSQASKGGCAVRIEREGRIETIMSAFPERVVKFRNYESTSPFEMISEEKGSVIIKSAI